MKSNHWKKLEKHLSSKLPGSIEKTEETDELEILVWNCWDEFEVKDQKKMDRPKFPYKMRKVSWKPPTLEFTIKKHGPYVDGSIYEVIQDWKLNVETKEAICEEHPRRKAWPEVHSEQVEDQIVEAIHSGKSLDVELQATLEDRVKQHNYICEGVSIYPLSALPPWDEEARKNLEEGCLPWAVLEDVVSEERLKELCEGGLPTPEELIHVARKEIEIRLEDSEYPVYGAYLYCLDGSDGREVWGVAYQQDDVVEEIDGPFLTREEALEAISKFGFTDPGQVTIEHVSRMLPEQR